MKKIVCLLLSFLCYTLCNTVWAAPTFAYQINGLTDPLLTNAQARLQSLIATTKNKPLTPQLIQEHYIQAPSEIIKALQPYGYYNPHIQSHLNNTGDNWQAVYDVDPGQPLRISHLEVSVIGKGKDDAQIQKLLNNFSLQKGQILTMPAYNQAKLILFNTAEQRGYITAQLTVHQIKINLQNYSATVILQLATGPRFYFGKVKFSKSPFAEKFLRRYMPFKEGEPYSSQKVLTFQDNLANSGYFKQALVQAQRDQAEDNVIPTQVKLVPVKPHQYTLGIGYGTDTGARATFGWDWRRITATGHRFSTLLRVSQVQQSFQAIYAIPGKNPLTDQYNITASVLNNIIPQGKSLTEIFGVADLTTKNNWKRNIFLNYQFERFHFEGMSTEHSNLLIPGVSWSYLKADNPIYPTHGQQFSVQLQGSGDGLVSMTNFAQTEIKDKYIFSPTRKSRILLSGDVGYTTVHDLQSFPLSLRYYAGGTQSLRGYKFQSLGPGRYLATGSVEYQHRIIGNWSGTVFYDVGNASDHFAGPLQVGSGFGVVWKSPVGPMELVVAKALNKPGRPNQIQFSMGPDLG